MLSSGNKDTEKFSHTPKVTQPLSNRTREAWAVWLQSASSSLTTPASFCEGLQVPRAGRESSEIGCLLPDYICINIALLFFVSFSKLGKIYLLTLDHLSGISFCVNPHLSSSNVFLISVLGSLFSLTCLL